MSHKVQQGLWPSTSYTTINGSMFDQTHKETTSKYDSRDPLHGIIHDKLKESYNPYGYIL